MAYYSLFQRDEISHMFSQMNFILQSISKVFEGMFVTD